MFKKSFLVRIAFIFSSALLILTAYAAWVVLGVPNAKKIQKCLTTRQYEVELCPKNKSYVRLDNISRYVKDLIVIAEDSTFFHHDGFDWTELRNSLTKNLNVLRFARGGSTITQQLAKNVFLDFDKSLTRKIREALLARDIEKILTKKEILEKYLNVIEFGKNIYGVRAASEHYFQKSPGQLNLLESAFLTYLVPNPRVHSGVYRKGKLTPYSRYRILDLTYRMFRFGKISRLQYDTAKELVDDFPWKNLTDYDLARLNGHVDEVEQLDVEELEALPETDESLTPVDVETQEGTETSSDHESEDLPLYD